jgi:16S rRNA (cytosine1402-N4)-methyltransferase
MSHVPVLLNEVLMHLLPAGGRAERVVDGTLGAGGHTSAMLEHGAARVLGLDVDPQAVAIASQALARYGERVIIQQRSYTQLPAALSDTGWDLVDAVLLDLGVSSMQLDTPERGFAFRHEAPLDMRFVADSRPTAADIVNQWEAHALTDILYRYGEEPQARLITKAIIRHRPIATTTHLAAVVEQALPFRPARKPGAKAVHPATRTFQALRIAVNDELKAIADVIPLAIASLRSGGRLGIISFHSLEDRIVKDAFREASTEVVPPPGMASLPARSATVRLITRKPVEASADEALANPRARSAKLRVVEKR